MSTTQCIHAHILQPKELAVHGILIESSTESTEVVMLTDSIQLEVLAIEPEACLSIEMEFTESGGCINLVNGLSVNNEFSLYIIYVRCLDRPEVRLRYLKLL